MRNKIIFFVILILVLVAGIFGVMQFSKANANTSTASNAKEEEKQEKQEDNIITINERAFATHINDIFMNAKANEGKTVKYEGNMYYYWEDDKKIVGRKNFCCGTDAYIVGFECVGMDEIPEENAWVEVEGIIRTKWEFEQDFPYLEVTKITVKEERGEETVYQ